MLNFQISNLYLHFLFWRITSFIFYIWLLPAVTDFIGNIFNYCLNCTGFFYLLICFLLLVFKDRLRSRFLDFVASVKFICIWVFSDLLHGFFHNLLSCGFYLFLLNYMLLCWDLYTLLNVHDVYNVVRLYFRVLLIHNRVCYLLKHVFNFWLFQLRLFFNHLFSHRAESVAKMKRIWNMIVQLLARVRLLNSPEVNLFL